MAKQIKLKIKNTQLAKALKLKGDKEPKAKAPPKKKVAEEEAAEPERKRVKARSRSVFAPVEEAPPEPEPVVEEAPPPPPVEEPKKEEAPPPKAKAKPAPKEPAPKKPAPAAQKPKETKPPLPPRKKKGKDFRDVSTKPATPARPFDSRDKYGLRAADEGHFRRRRPKRQRSHAPAQPVIRPSELTVRLPITIKDLAAQMKLKSSQLITKLFMQGVTLTLNDALDDETTVQLLGSEFDCEITIDTSEEERIRITGKTIKEEIDESGPEDLKPRGPVVAFMGHVDHGKTSLIDRIRSSNITSGEAGAITQHIGAFQCKTDHGPLTILDTPGHEAFTAMRARGATVTDVVILVVAGDEGVRPQTLEAIQHAKAGGVMILVAINKCDKPDFNADNVYRQLSEAELLPEAWGGGTVTVNCSATTGEGVNELLEMIALQADVLELKANPTAPARGTVLESEMHKGLGSVATILVQNGSLRHGDAVVFDEHWARIKTMRDEFGKEVKAAGPSMAVAITGLSGVPQAGSEFIVIDDEKEARAIAGARQTSIRERRIATKRRFSQENILQEAATSEKKILHLILRADVQGSLEALKTSLLKIESDKAEVNIIFQGVGAISESDVELAMASNAVILGFHTHVESHAEGLVKQHKVEIRLHDIIYHAIDDITNILAGRLDKVAEEREMGEAEVRATFKSSALGLIAGCIVKEGLIHRNHKMRQVRDGEVVWNGSISSIRREKEDVREVKAGVECGIVLDGNKDVQEGDILQAYEVIYVTQEL